MLGGLQMGEYALAGVDYEKIIGFKDKMVEVSKATAGFPERRGVVVYTDIPHSHGAVYEYMRPDRFILVQTTEGLGNLNWIAERMRQHNPTGPTYYDRIARAAALIIAIDVVAQGAMPVMWTDEVAAGQDSWFSDAKRASDYARGCYQICDELCMCLGQGESPALKYLVNTLPPVGHAPTLSGCIVGIIAPKNRLITGKNVAPGDHILGAPTLLLGSNGSSVIIKRGLTLPDEFLTKLPNGRTLGEEALQPVPNYIFLIESLLDYGTVPIHAIIPATDDGIAKIGFDKRPLTYRIKQWVDLPVIMQFMLDIGVTPEDVAKTFNCGIGVYLIVPPESVAEAKMQGSLAGFELVDLGVVEDGPRRVIFEPWDLTLYPAGSRA